MEILIGVIMVLGFITFQGSGLVSNEKEAKMWFKIGVTLIIIATLALIVLKSVTEYKIINNRLDRLEYKQQHTDSLLLRIIEKNP